MNALTLAFTCLIYHPVISVSARAGTVVLVSPLGVGRLATDFLTPG